MKRKTCGCPVESLPPLSTIILLHANFPRLAQITYTSFFKKEFHFPLFNERNERKNMKMKSCGYPLESLPPLVTIILIYSRKVSSTCAQTQIFQTRNLFCTASTKENHEASNGSSRLFSANLI